MNAKEFKDILTNCKYFECWADMIQSGFVYGRPLINELIEKDIEVSYEYESGDEDFRTLILRIGSQSMSWGDFYIGIRHYVSSYNGYVSDDFLNFEEVKPVTKTVTVYEEVRSRE